MAFNLKPLGDRVIIEPIVQEEVTKGGIVLPDTAKEKPQIGKVVAVGPGRLAEDGSRIEMEVKKGDTVIYSKYAGTEWKQDKKEYLILREGDIIAKKG